MRFGIIASSIEVGGGGGCSGCTNPSFVASTYAYNTTGTTATCNKPSGTTEGDLMVAIINCNSNTTITAPSGWNVIDEDDGIASTATVLIYYKIAGASEASSYDWTWSGNTRWGVAIATFSGSFDSDPSSGSFSYVYQSSSSNTAVTAPSVTTDACCSTAIFFGAYDQTSGGTWTEPSGYSAASDDSGVVNVYIGYKDFTDTGATGDAEYLCSRTDTYKVGWLWPVARNDN